jgi:hypothetical protein
MKSLLYVFLLAAFAQVQAATHYIGALDNTSSSTPTDRAALCIKSTMKLLDQIEMDDMITLVGIDDQPFVKKLPLLNETFNPKSANPIHMSTAKKALTLKVKATLDAWLKTSTNASYVFDGVYWAGDKFASTPNMQKKLVVCSDGVEESAVFTMRPLVPKNALDIVLAKKKVHKGLEGAEVTWIALGGENTEHTSDIETLWRAYFLKAGATVKSMLRNAS